MPVNTADFMSLADELMRASHCEEIHCRAAVSRAYYAAYHEAIVTADHLKLSVAEGAFGDHKKLVKRYSNGGKRLKIIANSIDTIRVARTTADYKVHNLFTHDGASDVLSICKSVVADVVKLRAVVMESA
jgi:uncharacterized protein (UPF0332 family)